MIHLHVTELLIWSSTVALPAEVVNTHGGLHPEKSCKYQDLLNCNGMTVKSFQDSFLLCISTACYQVKDNSPISHTVLVCLSHCCYFVSMPLLQNWAANTPAGLGAELWCPDLVPIPNGYRGMTLLAGGNQKRYHLLQIVMWERWWVAFLNCTFSALQSRGRICSLIHSDLLLSPLHNGCKQSAPKI